MNALAYCKGYLCGHTREVSAVFVIVKAVDLKGLAPYVVQSHVGLVYVGYYLEIFINCVNFHNFLLKLV